MNIRIATRKSALALWQARHVAARLDAHPEVTGTELMPLSTKGDEILDRSLQKIGGKGLFTKELEVAMQEGRADIAVHSMKDVPAKMPDGFCLAAMLERASPADALVSAGNQQLADLKDGARIGSSSLRRKAQLKLLRPDLRVIPLRGNVNTRLEKLKAGEFDAIVLAEAGLERLELAHHISQTFTPEELLPAAAQGVLGIECLQSNTRLRELLASLNDESAVFTTTAERAIARRLNASCQSPVAAYATLSGDSLSITALVAHPDGTESLRESHSGSRSEAESIGESLAERLITLGAERLLHRIESAGE